MRRICDCLYRWGCRYFVILNGHGGNTHALEKVCGYLDRKNAVGTVFNLWTVAGDLNPAWKGGHRAGEETAAMLAIDPKLVRKDLICDNAPKDPTDELHACGLRRVEFRGISLPLPRTNRKITDNGWYGPDHPSTATVEWGTEMLNTTADFLVDFMRGRWDLIRASSARRSRAMSGAWPRAGMNSGKSSTAFVRLFARLSGSRPPP